LLYRRVFTLKDGMLFINHGSRAGRNALLMPLLFLGAMPGFLNMFRGYIWAGVIGLLAGLFGVFAFIAIVIKFSKAIVLEKTQITYPRPFKIGDTTKLPNTPDLYICMTKDSDLYGKFTLSIDDVYMDFPGLATDVYLIAYLFYNNELKGNGRFSADYSEAFGKTALLPYVYIMLAAFITMSTDWISHSSFGFFIGLFIFQVGLLVGLSIGKKTGICIHQNKIALTNKEMGGGILDVDDISRIENDIIYDVNGKPMTFEGIEGWRYKRLARIISRYIEKKRG